MGIPCCGKNVFPPNIEGLPRGNHVLRPDAQFLLAVPRLTAEGTGVNGASSRMVGTISTDEQGL